MTQSPVRALLLTLIAALCVAPSVGAGPPPPHPDRAFEFEVRELVFRGLDGDSAALERVLDLCETALDRDPDNAEALVWHGSASLVLSGAAYRRGDLAAGGALWRRGLDEMRRAVELAPDDVSVLIPRAAALLGAARNLPFPDQARELTRTAVSDYERVYDLQQPYFDRMSEHARGELLLGLADGHHRLGQETDVARYMEIIARELPETEYAEAAADYLAADSRERALPVRTCRGCHGGSGSEAGR